MRWIEFTLFLALAIVPHLIIFIGRTQSGVTAGGGGGDTAVTLRAAAPTVAEMVQSWEEPSVVQTATPTELSFSRPLSVDNPTRPVVQADEAQIAIAIAVSEAEDPVQIDSTPPPPPIPETAIEPASDVGPKQRPPKKPMQEGRKAEITSVGAAKQVSAGSGGGAQTGSGSAKVRTASPGQEANLTAIWGTKIRARIESNKRYPRGTKASGDATITLTVSWDGRLVSHQLAKSSGDPTLDQAALSAARARKDSPNCQKN